MAPAAQPVIKIAERTLPVMSSAGQTITFSPETQMALSGGMFDARVFFKKAKPTGIDEMDERAKLTFRNKVKLVDLLTQHEDLVAGALGWVEDKIMGVSSAKKPATSATKDVPQWPGTYIYMEKVPKYWRAEFIARNLARYGLTASRLSVMDAALPNGINEMFDFVLAFHGKTKIPRVCLDKSIMHSFFAERLQDMGRASTEWLETLTDGYATPPVLNWAKAGCFKVLKEGDNLILKHVSGAKVPPQSQILSFIMKATVLAKPYELTCIKSRLAWLS